MEKHVIIYTPVIGGIIILSLGSGIVSLDFFLPTNNNNNNIRKILHNSYSMLGTVLSSLHINYFRYFHNPIR